VSDHTEDPEVPPTEVFLTPSPPDEITPQVPSSTETEGKMEDFKVPPAPDVSLPHGHIGHIAVAAGMLLIVTLCLFCCTVVAIPYLKLFGVVGCWLALRGIVRLVTTREELDSFGLFFFWWSLCCYLAVLTLSVLLVMIILHDMKGH
jgi:hypothetical protein